MRSILNKIFQVLTFLLFSLTSFASPNDTTTVYVHQDVDMTWYGNYDRQAIFPDGSISYRKVIMTYTLGCSSTGCSDWDYTTQIHLRRPTGNLDSTITSIDTLSVSPLIIDTTWNVYEVVENMELGRVITPYGGYMANGQNGYSNNWKHRYVFDVTDYVHLLKDTVDIRAHYSGWSNGFSVSLRFDFIEGTPPRDILSVQNIYKGSKGYSNSANFESTYFTPKDVVAPSDAVSSRIFSTITGHGFDNNVNCAEFCPRSYTVKMNGSQIGNATIWNDNCGSNPIYPQGGTWIYDRAGWCPGGKGDIHSFETNVFTTGTNSVDFDMQNYTWSGSQQPSYTVNAHIVFYDSMNFQTDAEVFDIIMPTNHEEHSLMNPFCGNPRVMIKNNGAATIQKLMLSYGVEGSVPCIYNWTGTINRLETVEIDLPTMQLEDFINGNSNRFYVSIVEVNDIQDDYPYDNQGVSEFTLPDVLTYPFIYLGVGTNNYGNETSYSLTDKDGNVILSRDQGTLSSNTLYKDSLILDAGCYTLTVNDAGGDGLGWWANTAQGAGEVSFYSPFITFVKVKSFGVDFGNQLRYNFIMYTPDSIQSDCILVGQQNTVADIDHFVFEMYPNPAHDYVDLHLISKMYQSVMYQVVDMTGRVHQRSSVHLPDQKSIRLQTDTYPSGFYFVQIKSEEGILATKKLVISHP